MHGTSARAAPHHPELLHPSSQTCMLASLYRHITDAHIHVYVYIYTHILERETYIYIQLYIYIYVFIFIYNSIYIYKYIHIYIYVYIYIYIYIHIQSPSELSGFHILLISTLQDPRSRQAQRDAPSAHFVAVVALARSDRSAHEALVSERHISRGSGFPSFGLRKT